MPETEAVTQSTEGEPALWNAAVRLQARTVKEAGMLEIVWRNPRPPKKRTLRIEEVWADESTVAPMWVIFYHTILDSGWSENEYRLFVNRHVAPSIAV